MLEMHGAISSLYSFMKKAFARVFDAEARYFLLRTQKKVPKEKGAQSTRRSSTGTLRFSKNRALRNSRYAPHCSRSNSARFIPDFSAVLGEC